jgi:hypothetical protein
MKPASNCERAVSTEVRRQNYDQLALWLNPTAFAAWPRAHPSSNLLDRVETAIRVEGYAIPSARTIEAIRIVPDDVHRCEHTRGDATSHVYVPVM